MIMHGFFRICCYSLAQGCSKVANGLGEAERKLKEKNHPQDLIDGLERRRLFLSDLSEAFMAARDYFDEDNPTAK